MVEKSSYMLWQDKCGKNSHSRRMYRLENLEWSICHIPQNHGEHHFTYAKEIASYPEGFGTIAFLISFRDVKKNAPSITYYEILKVSEEARKIKYQFIRKNSNQP